MFGLGIAKGGSPTGRRVKRLGSRGVMALAPALALGALTAAPVAATNTYYGPFGTLVDVGSATCWVHNDYVWSSNLTDNGTRLSKDLVLEGPAVRMGTAASFGQFAAVKWTVSIKSLASGASQWAPWPDRTYWGGHTGVMSTTWTFESPRIGIQTSFSGQILVTERLNFTDATGRTVAGGSWGPVQPALISHVYSYAPSVDQWFAGVCVL